MNKCILMGRLTTDPELKQTTQGVSVSSFSIAVPRDSKRDTTDFFNAVAWRQTAEFICKWFKKGSLILITGELNTRKYEDREGQRHTVTEITVSTAEFCGEKKDDTKKDSLSIPYVTPTFFEPQQQEGAQLSFQTIGSDDDLPF